MGFGKGGIVLILGVIGLAACGGGAPPDDVSPGVGFQDYQAYQARRAALLGETAGQVAPVVPPSAPVMARVTAPEPQTARDPAPVSVEVSPWQGAWDRSKIQGV
ncbi:hypothetical protein HKCCSP123_11385, partial [Rhodobacterales bacterium HKCCSP123]|nr:hypothetical protein [Rhodobacterales bacterium HKCCSP123]